MPHWVFSNYLPELPELPDDPNDLERPKGTLQEELGNVTMLLDAGKFSDAIRLLQKCSHWYAECPLFSEPDSDKSEKSTASDESETEKPDSDEESESEKDDEEEDESERTETSKSKRKMRKTSKVDWFALARNVYLREPPRKPAKNQKLDEHDELSSSEEPDEQVHARSQMNNFRLL